MRMQAEVQGLIARNPSLLVAKAGDWPGKAQDAGSKGSLHR